MDGTIIQQGTFVSTGITTTLPIRSDLDWMWLYNYNVINAATANYGANFYWQRGMAANDAIINHFDAAGTGMVMTTAAAGPVNGFTLVDSSGVLIDALIATTASTNATQPVVNTANTTGLVTGSIVRLYNVVGQEALGGIDFEVDTIVAGVSFRIRYAMANVPGGAGAAGHYRRLVFDPIYYPRRRYLANITQAANAVVHTTVQHGYTIGQEVRFNIPAKYGMVELDGLTGSILAVTAATITVDINTTAFTAFAFPVAADVPFTPATVTPLGEATQAIVGKVTLDDATLNTGYIGIELGAGNTSPAGNNLDVLYWVAGKSFNL